LFFEREKGGERALAVHLYAHQQDGSDPLNQLASDLDEFLLLIRSAGAELQETYSSRRRTIHPKTFVSTGKLEELKQLVQSLDIELVLFNNSLSPTQERNLEKELCCRVVDRTGLILDIFAQRARTFEGKLQVELAQLKHLATRLVRGWTHLERQKGGIGLRGPGESQLETDRRLIRARINHIQKRLEKVSKQRQQGRRSRQRSSTPTISLVGYTNAGKSTLFNTLTESEVFAKDLLFATLDPTFRQIELARVGETVLADTVGFIRDLPHDLVEAFSATLEETREADLLLHVVDASSPESYENIKDVETVLKQIGADEVPCLMVFNKIDQLADNFIDENAGARVDRDDTDKPFRVWVSAQEDLGLETLKALMSEFLEQDMLNTTIRVKPSWGKLRAWCFKQEAVLSEEVEETGDCLLQVSLPLRDFNQALKRNNLSMREVLAEPA
jgi:GTP-binding protein HflX